MAGSVSGVSFRSFENLTGGTISDTFAFADGATVRGRIDGGQGSNTLDFSAYATSVVVNLQARTATGTGGWLNIADFIGGSGTNALVAANRANTWNLTGDDSGNIGGSVLFQGFANLKGGTLADAFNLLGGDWSGLLDGAAGKDTSVLGAAALPIFSETNPQFDVLQKPFG